MLIDSAAVYSFRQQQCAGYAACQRVELCRWHDAAARRKAHWQAAQHSRLCHASAQARTSIDQPWADTQAYLSAGSNLCPISPTKRAGLLCPVLFLHIRLQSRAQSVHNRVYREAYGCGRKGDARSTGLMLDGVQDVMDTLAGYR